MREARSSVRLAEVIGALSVATDLAMGQPMEYALSSCVLAVRLGEALGLSEAELRTVYYQALLRYIGCNAETYVLAALVGDEISLRIEFAAVDPANTTQVVGLVTRYLRQANQGAPPLQLARTLVQGLLGMRGVMQQAFAGHCEVAQRLAERLGLGTDAIRALGQLYERWDGRGLPHGLRGEQIDVSVRVVTLAQDAITFLRLGGTDAAIAIARERSGAAYDPGIANRFCEAASQLLAGLDQELPWETVLTLEPGEHARLTEEQLDTACEALADFGDLKSPYRLGHSRGVAALAAEGARRSGLPTADVTLVRRAGWLHDLGQVAISAGVWGQTTPLTEPQWEQVRLHAYYTERILARPAALAQIGTVAALHHERLDGSGYFRGAAASHLSPAARILAAADVYQALTEPRPHRAGLGGEEAVAHLRREVREGRLDVDAVDGVLGAAGHQVRPRRRELVAGLSEREIEVLRLLARGGTTRQVADALVIAPKTVDNHVQHIYNKIGVSTRAGATLFAIEQDLLGPPLSDVDK